MMNFDQMILSPQDSYLHHADVPMNSQQFISNDLTDMAPNPFANLNSCSTDGVKMDPRSWKLSDFEFLHTIGTGSFGRVKLVRHKDLNTYFACKIMHKALVIKMNQVQHIKDERSILLKIHNHPFIINLYATFQDENTVYLIMEYVSGGELFTHLRTVEVFPNDVAKFYTAEVVLAFEYLHRNHIVYRDLKPENLLIDKEGHIKITDFGFAKVLSPKNMFRTFTVCGTNEYLAPELIQQKGHGMAADWWTLGVLIFELLVGYPPFVDDNIMRLYQKILNREIEFPVQMDRRAKDLIRQLLKPEMERLGNLKGGAKDVMNHPWFDGVNWDMLYKRVFRAPITPDVQSDGDTSQFTHYDEESRKERQQNGHAITKDLQRYFEDF